MTTKIAIPQDEIAAFCERNHIRKLSLFGSILRDDFRPDSDVDFLVEYEPNAIVTLLDMATQEIELGHLIGRKVDLRTPPELSRYFRQEVVNTAEKLYERN
jgi:predicted nucleotidyltransferase